jgi:hypothetical protein
MSQRTNSQIVANEAPSTIEIDGSEVTLSVNRTGNFSEIIDIRVPANYRYIFPADKPIEMYLMAHEQFSHGGTGDETFNIPNDLLDAAGLPNANTSGSSNSDSGHRDLVVYDSGSQTAIKSVDYANDKFVYNSGSGTTLDVYYTWGDSSEIQAFEKSANLDEQKQRFGSTAAAVHSAKPFSDNEAVTFGNQFELGPKERLKFYVNTSLDLENWEHVSGGNGPNSTDSYSYFRIPAYKLKTR